MPDCDGDDCEAKIPWRITAKTNLTDGGLFFTNKNYVPPAALQNRKDLDFDYEHLQHHPFSVNTVHNSLLQVMTAGGCGDVAVVKRPVNFKTLCDECWLKQAAAWDGGAGVYELVRAKTTADGMYFKASLPVFFNANEPEKQRILSCVCHELMHYWSRGSIGLQELETTSGANWDELTADFLGYLVYQKTYNGTAGFTHYWTPYNDYATSLSKKVSNSFPAAKFINNQNERAKLPPLLKTFFDTKSNSATAVADARKLVAGFLFKSLATWFFRGPTHQIEEAGGTASQFCTKFGNWWAGSSAFGSGYVEKGHAI